VSVIDRRYLLAALLLGALTVGIPLLRGGVAWETQVGAGITAALIVAACAPRLDSRVPWPALGLAAGVAAIALQLLPLPAFLVGLVSPGAADVFDRSLRPLGLYPAMRPLSVDPPETARELAKAATYTLAFAGAAFLAQETRWRRWIRLSLAASGLGVALWMLGTGAVAARAPFVNPNHGASLLALTVWFFLAEAIATNSGGQRATWLALFAVVAAALLLTLSRGGIAAFVVGGAVFLWLEQRGRSLVGRSAAPVVAAAVGGALAVGAYLGLEPILAEVRTVADAGSDNRFVIWAQALPMLARFPIIGVGRGAFATTFPAFRSDEAQVTYHYLENEWLQLPIDLGVPLGLAFLVMVALAWWHATRIRDLRPGEKAALAGIAAVAAHNAVDFSLELLGVALPFAVALGLATARVQGPVLSSRQLRTVGGALALALIVGIGIRSSQPTREAAGRILVEGDRESAVAIARESVKAHPADYLPHAAAGARLVQENRCAEAMPWLTRAMALAPNVPGPHRQAARCLAASGQHVFARREFRLAISLGDRDALAEAMRWYSAVPDLLEVTPATPAGLLWLGEALRKERPADARVPYTRAWEELGEPQALLALSELAYQLKDFATSEALARRHQVILPNHPGGYAVAAATLLEQGKRPEADEQFRLGMTRAPGRVQVLGPYAAMLTQDRRFVEARKMLAMVIPPNPADAARLRLAVADTYRAEGKMTQAIEEARAASAIAPTEPSVHESLANLCESAKRYDEAIAALERAATLAGPQRARFDKKLATLRLQREESVDRARLDRLAAPPPGPQGR
jgi:tetratricopeptide (TPR) repeat protein/O-antigen ligase